MRISDWSSDVCSSDLRRPRWALGWRCMSKLLFVPADAEGGVLPGKRRTAPEHDKVAGHRRACDVRTDTDGGHNGGNGLPGKGVAANVLPAGDQKTREASDKGRMRRVEVKEVADAV